MVWTESGIYKQKEKKYKSLPRDQISKIKHTYITLGKLNFETKTERDLCSKNGTFKIKADQDK